MNSSSLRLANTPASVGVRLGVTKFTPPSPKAVEIVRDVANRLWMGDGWADLGEDGIDAFFWPSTTLPYGEVTRLHGSFHRGQCRGSSA